MSRVPLLVGTDFHSTAPGPALAGDEIHLWLRELPAGIAPRDVSATARATLLRLLAHYGGMAEVPALARGPHGKPHAPDLPGLEFNLSHGGRAVLAAFARDQALGVDVESRLRQRPVDELAGRFFAAREISALSLLAPADRLDAFLRLWTSKEAVLKALGHGLSFGLDRLAFDLDAAGRPGSLAAIAAEGGVAADWQLLALEPLPDHFGALAWRGASRLVRAFRLAG